MNENKYGHATIGYGTKDEKKVPILNFLQAEFKDHRLCTLSEIENGEESQTFILMIENPESTGRDRSQQMLLSKESLLGLLSTSFLYFMSKGESLTNMLQEAVDNKEMFDYRISDNLKPINLKEDE